MSTFDEQIKEFKKNIIDLIKINYDVSDITESNKLLKSNYDEKETNIKDLITKINTEIEKYKSYTTPLKKINKLYNFYDDLDNYSITFKKLPEPIKASLKLKKLDLKVIDSSFDIEKEKSIINKFKKFEPGLQNIIPNVDSKFDYNDLISKLKIPLDKKKINDAVEKISFIKTKENIILNTSRLQSINKQITEYYTRNNININLNPKPIFKMTSPYLKDIPDLIGGNDNTYIIYYKKNEKYFLIIYYILYNYYEKLLTKKLITDQDNKIIINSDLLNLKYIYTEYTFFFNCYNKLKNIDKQHNNIIFFKHYFQIFIIYYFLKCILLKFNPDNTRTETEYKETYISFNILDPSYEELELEKLIILFIKSTSN
jgi:hypothetical protein